MCQERSTAFIEKVKGDSILQEKLNGDADADTVVEIAKEAEFIISADDLKDAHPEPSDEELEGAAGGWLRCQVNASID